MSKPFNYCEAEARTWKECQAAPARLRPPLPSHCDRPRPACGSEHSQRVATAAGRCGAMHHLAHNPVRPAPAGARWGWHSMAAIAPLPVRHARSALVQHGKHGQPGKVPDHAARHGCCAQPPPHRARSARHRTAPAQRHPLRAARRVNAPLRPVCRCWRPCSPGRGRRVCNTHQLAVRLFSGGAPSNSAASLGASLAFMLSVKSPVGGVVGAMPA